MGCEQAVGVEQKTFSRRWLLFPYLHCSIALPRSRRTNGSRLMF
jgi:hypothetical protein